MNADRPEIDPEDPSGLREVTVEVANLAADLVRQSVGRAIVTGTKSSPTDPVTDTDVAAEKLIRSELERHRPGSSIVGEECDDTVGTTGVGWIVDPIDGTVNFAYDLPVVAVSIAATVDGKVVAGAVADVLRREVFSAAVGHGAERDGQPLSPTGVTDLGEALVMTGFAYDADLRAEQAQTLTRVLPAVRDIRCMGSAALNLCWVASGRADAFFERDLKVYDHAAGVLIATEAGAFAVAPPLAQLPTPSSPNRHLVASPMNDDLVLASAPGIHVPLLALLSGS